MRVAIGESLVRTAYALFLVLVAFAVADYGLTRADSLLRFQLITFVVVGLWLAGCLIATRWPRTGWVPWVPVVAIAALGWGKAWLGPFFARREAAASDIIFSVYADPDSLWGILYQIASVHPDASYLATGTSIALLGGFLLAIEIWRDHVWSRALLMVMLVVGFTLTVLFFLQTTIGEPFQLENLRGSPTSFFVYNYWGNGAAFLNLFWPVGMGVAIFCGIQRSRFWPVLLAPPLIIFAAVFVNVSKAGNVLAIGAFVLFLVLIALPVVRMVREFDVQISKNHLIAILIPVLVIGLSCYFAIPWDRWDYYLSRTDSVESDTRYKAYVQFLRMIPDAGWTGFGPGTFDGIHRGYFEGHPDLLKAPFWTAHQDYIQTVVEWGKIGAALWALIFLPAVAAMIWGLFKRVYYPSLPRKHYGWGIWDPLRQFFLGLPEPNQPLLLAGVLAAVAAVAAHAAVDFPFQVPSIGLLFLVWIALGWSQLSRQKSEDSDWDEEE